MMHFTCDFCHRCLDAERDLRYVVRMEVYAAMDPMEAGEVDADRDHLQEVHEIIERMEDVASDQIGDDVYQTLRFDLCPACRKKFLNNPLGRTLVEQFQFSKN